MAEGGKRTAVLLDGQALWVDAVARALAPEGIEAVAKLREPAQALAALAEHEPDLFVLDPRPVTEALTASSACAAPESDCPPCR